MDIARPRAVFSPRRKYRYRLTRSWHPATVLLPIIMLNPSTADETVDDPTIRRCASFARREGYGGIEVVNLFAFRATSPADMKAAADPIGRDNDMELARLFGSAVRSDVPVLAAWGAHGSYLHRAANVLTMASAVDAQLVCLGTTAAGHRRHPLYVKGDQPLERFG